MVIFGLSTFYFFRPSCFGHNFDVALNFTCKHPTAFLPEKGQQVPGNSSMDKELDKLSIGHDELGNQIDVPITTTSK